MKNASNIPIIQPYLHAEKRKKEYFLELLIVQLHFLYAYALT